MIRDLEIVSFDIPFPPNYGGAIDIFYRIKALHELGVRIVLHCFHRGPVAHHEELESMCQRVLYYPRKSDITKAITRTPYIVSSRSAPQLLSNLEEGTCPILFEGLHTCAFVGHKSLHHRLKFVRMHNVEWEYYLALSETANAFWKRLHFKRESIKLRRFERRMLKEVNCVFAISESDKEYFGTRHEFVQLIPPFHQYEDVVVQVGEGTYVLFQGDLSVDDNYKIIRELSQVISSLGVPVRIAGRSGGRTDLAELLAGENIEIFLDVSVEKMQKLMLDAQIHVIDSNITSGFKLKLIAALHTARHIVARRVLVSKELRNVVCTYSDRKEISTLIRPLMQRPVSREDVSVRRAIVGQTFSNAANASRLMKSIGEYGK